MVTLYFTWLFIIFPVILWAATAIWTVMDAERIPNEAWRKTGESRTVWTLLAIFLFWPIGFIYYAFVVRRPLNAEAEKIAEDAQYERHKARWNEETGLTAPEDRKNENGEYPEDEDHLIFRDHDEETSDHEYREHFDGTEGYYEDEVYSPSEDFRNSSLSCCNGNCHCERRLEEVVRDENDEDPDTSDLEDHETSSVPVVYPAPKDETRIMPPIPTTPPTVQGTITPDSLEDTALITEQPEPAKKSGKGKKRKTS